MRKIAVFLAAAIALCGSAVLLIRNVNKSLLFSTFACDLAGAAATTATTATTTTTAMATTSSTTTQAARPMPDGNFSADETCRGGWPLFRNMMQLSASPWGTYFKLVYGELPLSGYPICPGDFYFLHETALKTSNILLPESKKHGCPPSLRGLSSEGYWAPVPEPPWMIAVLNFEQPFPRESYEWVEVMHRARSVEGGFERNGAWFGYAKGSGIWVNLGKTLALNTHDDGLLFFGAEGENDMALKAAHRGYDSIQFLKGDGSVGPCCKKFNLGPSCHGMEFVSTKLQGTWGCAEPPGPQAGGKALRAGWNASRPCNCNEEANSAWSMNGKVMSYLHCEGVPGRAEKAKLKAQANKECPKNSAWPCCEDGKFGMHLCSDWCNTDVWPGCGVNSIGGTDPRNTDGFAYICSCAGCNGCPA